MKTPKLMTAFIAIFLFSNSLSAQNANRKEKIKMSDKMFQSVSAYTDLTDKQKQLIQKSAKDYEANTNKYMPDITMKNRNEIMHAEFLKHRRLVDSLLTPQQKDTLKIRRARQIMKEIANSKK